MDGTPLLLGVSFAAAFLTAPSFIQKLRAAGFVVKDYYKRGRPLVPTMGGLVILTGVLASLIIAQFVVSSVENLLILYFIVLTFMVLGLIDDLVDVGRKLKIVLPYFMALPVALLNRDTSLWLGFTEVELGALYTFIVAPVYVMVVSNLINMHAGYNGLAVGLSSILLTFVGIAAWAKYGAGEVAYVMPILGAALAFLFYNRYPSRIFEGNCGNFMLGAALGALLVLYNLELFGVIILLPHIVNFLMYVVWRIKKIGEVKFGEVREDGSLKVPNPLTLKWLLPYYYRVTEPQAVLIMYLLTTLSGLLGLALIFW
ncbi:MAG: UDP-N-acetylglucosamine-1-phosphate transferase [Euryarchaeota archaeon]|nr:UDP-N-acetylglucosamine-1-phosphate transferase [Euryarchaeota archaeon]